MTLAISSAGTSLLAGGMLDSRASVDAPAVSNTFAVAWLCVQDYRVFRGGNTW
jgi:hypothetical protein